MKISLNYEQVVFVAIQLFFNIQKSSDPLWFLDQGWVDEYDARSGFSSTIATEFFLFLGSNSHLSLPSWDTRTGGMNRACPNSEK